MTTNTTTVIKGAKPNEKLALELINDSYDWVAAIEFVDSKENGYHVFSFGYTDYSEWDIADTGAWEVELKPIAVDGDGIASQYLVYGYEQVY